MDRTALVVIVAAMSAFLLFGLGSPAQAENVLNRDSAIGMNLEKNQYRKPRVAFANALKSGRSWRESPNGSSCGGNASNYSGPSDSNGYPTSFGSRECIFTQLFQGSYAEGAWPIGEWVLRWDGDATFGVGSSASNFTPTAPGRGTFDVSAGNYGIRLQIESIPNSVSNMRLYPPGGVCHDGATPIPFKFCSTSRCAGGSCNDAHGCDGAETCVDLEVAGEAGNVTFHPLWLSHLRQYRTLRFMNWLHTNHSRVEDFSEWLPESHYTWNYEHDPLGAVPLSIIARLCNELNSACYVNVPSLATDAHITEFAEFFRDHVNPNLPVYIEYSNEVWNPGFEQHDFASQQAYELWQSDPAAFDGADCEDVEPNSASEFDCANHWHGKRTYEMCALAQAAFDATGEGDRLFCVSGRRISQSGSELGTNLDCTRWTGAPNGDCYTGSDIDVLAVNVYFGKGSEDCGSTEQAACDAAMSNLARKVCDGPGCPVTELTQALDARGLSWPIMIYEGGSHLDDQNSPACTDLTIDADSCLIDVYHAALDQWKDLAVVGGYDVNEYIFFDHSGRQALNAPGNLFGHRGSNEGSWPKETALLDWDDTSGNECWWTGCELESLGVECADGIDNDGDGTIDGADPGCDFAGDASERSAALPCDNGSDDDGDGRVDFDPVTFSDPLFAAGSGDPGCWSPSWGLEDPQCQNGANDDSTFGTDFDGGVSILGSGSGDSNGADPQCVATPWSNREAPAGCGLGFELAPILGLLYLVAAHRRRRVALESGF